MVSLRIAFGLIVTICVIARADEKPLYLDSTKSNEARVEDLLGRLTLEEKISLIHANSKFGIAGIPRLGIPARWTDDGPLGVREDVQPNAWTPAGRTDDFATALPATSCLAATWNIDLAKAVGETIGEEARHRGKDIMLGPAVNIQRTPLCGRNFEYMGEDPFLTSRIAVNYINGEQSRDVASCVKHFALNNQESDRGGINVEVDERALREIYLPAFRAAVTEANVLTIMGAYNKFRGQHCCESPLLLNQILKGEWSFKGLVMTDWGAVHNTKLAAMNGLDLEMGTDAKAYDDWFFANALIERVKSGEISQSVLDDKVRRNLYVMFATKMFDPADRKPGSFNTKQHQATARRVADEGIVLLKNDKEILPLDPNKIHSIAVIGDNATRLQAAGGGSAGIKAFYEVSPLNGIVVRAGDKVNVTFSQGYRVPPRSRRRPTTEERQRTPETKPSEIKAEETLIARAVEAAKNADVAIVIGGLNHNRLLDDEGSDRADMKMPYGQDELIRAVSAVNPKTIVVLVSGGAVEMPWIEQIPGIMQAWYGGMEAGNAIAGVLFGDVNPSGKLPCTFPKKLDDSPAHALHAYPGENHAVEYKEGLLVGYRWFDTKQIEPLFPFGHGLSYTHFEYSNLTVKPASQDTAGAVAIVELDLANTGERAGGEVVQVYVHDVESSLPRPDKELKAFTKVALGPGEKQHVTISLPRRAFAFYDPAKSAWVAEAGDFDLLVGSSSRDIRQHATYTLSQSSQEK
jgi:beta-glucosidase